jgi:ParB/RepB/Spo0J family partition protein
MAVPRRSAPKRPGKSAGTRGLASAEHSDISAVVSSIINAQQPDSDIESAVAGVRLLHIPLDELTYNPRNPREENIEEDEETHGLAVSMALLGQQQPAVVIERDLYLQRWPHEADRIPTPWVLMDGNRRRAAAKINQWASLECVTRDQLTDNLDKLADLPFHANIHHKKINPLLLAYYLADKVDELGGQVAVAKFMGKSQPWVNHMLKLCKLVPELQRWVKAGEINARLGRELFKLDATDQRRIAAEVDQLGEEDKRTEYWSTGAWRPYNPVIAPDEPTSPAQAAEPAEKEPEPQAARTRPAIVIRLADRSPTLLAAALRERLSSDEVKELVHALLEPAADS